MAKDERQELYDREDWGPLPKEWWTVEARKDGRLRKAIGMIYDDLVDWEFQAQCFWQDGATAFVCEYVPEEFHEFVLGSIW